MSSIKNIVSTSNQIIKIILHEMKEFLIYLDEDIEGRSDKKKQVSEIIKNAYKGERYE